MMNPRLIGGLTAPLGMAVNPVATRTFPHGSNAVMSLEIAGLNRPLAGPADIAIRTYVDGTVSLPDRPAVSVGTLGTGRHRCRSARAGARTLPMRRKKEELE
jgi:hypothetical protein